MDNKKNFSDIIEQSDDQAFQSIIDRQEAALSKEECRAPGTTPLTKERLEKWEKALDRLPGHPEQRCSRRKLRRTVILAAIITALLLAAAASAFHAQLLNWWERVREEVSIFNVEEDPESVIQTWKGFYKPTEIPGGFQIARASDGRTTKIIEYRDAAGSRILFYQYTADASVGLDKEHAAALKVQSQETAQAYEKDNVTNYYWFVEERAYLIVFDTDTVTLDAVEQMAKSLYSIS